MIGIYGAAGQDGIHTNYECLKGRWIMAAVEKTTHNDEHYQSPEYIIDSVPVS